MKHIPNLLTLLNLFFGCCAIVMTGQLWMASLFIFLAACADFLDGGVARLLKAGSPLGKQLDSLSDVVSFGVAPSIILFHFLRAAFARESHGMDISWWWLTPAFLFACAAAYRLGKFNLDEEQQKFFKGVPSPLAGLVVASLPLIYWFSSNDFIQGILLNKWMLYGIILLLGWLMISDIPMLSLKFSRDNKGHLLPVLLLAAIALVSAFILSWITVPVVFIAYIALSLLFKKRFT